MKTDQYGQIIYSQEDLCNFVMQGHNLLDFENLIVDSTVDLETAVSMLEDVPTLIRYNELVNDSVEEFDHRCQNNWHMPNKYKELDIAEHVLGLCKNDAELQRCGQELMLFQERDLFNLLRYLVSLVDLMRENRVIWGVGRGSSVSSYVLYKLGVHRVDSLHYDLDPTEFLR
jgi:DNA polymerase III alpha subunit